MQQPFIQVAVTPQERAIERDLAEAAARSDALLAYMLAERERRIKMRKSLRETVPAGSLIFEI